MAEKKTTAKKKTEKPDIKAKILKEIEKLQKDSLYHSSAVKEFWKGYSMRLIDADALEEVKFHSNEDLTPVEIATWQLGWNDAINAIINNAPTVDPYKHGHWIEHEVGLICSECNHYTDAMYDEPFNNEFGKGWALKRPYYCGYCGAKMDEVEE